MARYFRNFYRRIFCNKSVIKDYNSRCYNLSSGVYEKIENFAFFGNTIIVFI